MKGLKIKNFLKMNDNNNGLYKEIDNKSGIVIYELKKEDGINPSIITFQNNILISKTWLKNGKKYQREGNLPSQILYYKNGNKHYEEWYDNDKFNRKYDNPALIQYDEDGNIIREKWFLNDKFHREGDLPAEKAYSNSVNGINIISEHWYKNGLLHRESDNPAFRSYLNNKLKFEYYYKNGKSTKENGLPNQIEYNENGTVKEEKYGDHDIKIKEYIGTQIHTTHISFGFPYLEEWKSNEKLHRENDLPATIKYYDVSGIQKVEEEQWYRNGKLHREGDLPAFVLYHRNNKIVKQNGSIKRQTWYKNDNLYREGDGTKPVVIEYDENGKIVDSQCL